MKLLVTGATGTIGGHVMRALLGTGHDVRVLVRSAGRFTPPHGVEVVEGDLTNADAVRRALRGVDRAFLNMADDNGAVFARVAGELRLGHVVLLSSFTTFVPLPTGENNIVAARHVAGEQALRAAGVPATFLRAAGFDYNILLWARAAGDGVIRAPYLDVALPIVHPADIATSAAAILLADTPPTGAYTITGPEMLTVRDQARILSEVAGRDLHVEQISEEEAKRTTFPDGTPDLVITSVLETMSSAAAVLNPTNDVQTLSGRAPRTFRDWATENLSLLPRSRLC